MQHSKALERRTLHLTNDVDDTVGRHLVPQHQLHAADQNVALLVHLQDHVVPGSGDHLHLLLHHTGANNLRGK